jgi:CHAT domain-containing protein
VARSPLTADELELLAKQFLSAIEKRSPVSEVSELGRQLYAALIAPVAARASKYQRLCIIPDKILHFIPFSALRDSADRYTIDSWALTSAPSAVVLIRCLREAALKSLNTTEHFVGIGDPDFDQKAFPQLPALPDAREEVITCAKDYGNNSVTLIGKQATEPAVREAMQRADVLHLASHCLVESRSPWLAALLLAPSGETRTTREAAVLNGTSSERDGMLYLNELMGLRLPRTRLVVLSACQSALGQYYRGEGIVSLVHPFLIAKVQTIVASLWPVESQPSSRLMIEFHRERLKHNGSAGEAMRAAQSGMAHSEEYGHPYYWAAFVTIGAGY